MIRGLITFAAVAVLTTSCAAAQKGGPYAGVDPYDAGTAAHDIIDQETATPGSPLHNRELVVICVSDLPTRTAIGLSENLAIRPCHAPRPAPSEPAPTAPPAV